MSEDLISLPDTEFEDREKLVKETQQLAVLFSRWHENPQRVSLTQIFNRAHRVLGHARSFGANVLAQLLTEYDRILREAIADGKMPSSTTRSQLVSLTKKVLAAPIPVRKNTSPFEVSPGIPEAIRTARRDIGPIYIVDDDTELANSIAEHLESVGFSPHAISDLDTLKKRVFQETPAAIIMDVVFPEGALAGTQKIAELSMWSDNSIPVIFISNREDLEARLEAVRVNGKAYISKPFETEALIDRLDQILLPDEDDPYRVLIVDDEPTTARLHQFILEKSGMRVETLLDPSDIIRTVIDLRPDIILMDLYMPTCTGIELARVIRQMDQFIHVPIVFLSGETDLQKQIDAMSIGGDDFLTKPIKPEYLVSALSNRIERARSLFALVARDSMTGLLNHKAILEHLTIEILRASRLDSPLSFVMLDLDHFKQVNDSYGHAMGDRVLKKLSRMLKENLRSSDWVGRYGGEEFAIVLPDTNISSAVLIMEKFRTLFNEVPHITPKGTEVFVTLSAGVAGYPEIHEPDQLREAADQALYAAKQAGRNCVKFAKS
jgi:diguanylate cyclase (GGDEF)-like protein